MESDGVPDEYVDMLVNEFAYDPIRLQVEEDPLQLLYDRTTLETIWETKHEAVNPYTRKPFDISKAVPQAELRQQMSQYIHENPTLTLGLEVIPDYTNALSTRDMKNLLMELSTHLQDLDFHCSIAIAADNTGQMNEEKYWKTLWKKLNLLRLYCQYNAENRETFSSIKGYEDLFTVIDKPLLDLCLKYYHFCRYANKVCREVARIVDIIGLKDSDLRTLPEKSLWAFVHILPELVRSEYMKIQSMVLRIYRMMFFDCSSYLSFRCNIFCDCVVDSILSLLMRGNVTEITNEDLYNGSATLMAAWKRNTSQLLAHGDYVDALVNVVIFCISRFESLHEAAVHSAHSSSHNSGHDQPNDIHISMALHHGFCLIDCLVKDDLNERYSYFDEILERLQTLDIVKYIVRMVELVLSGFEFMEPSLFGFGLYIAWVLYQYGGVSVIRREDVETFRRFLGSNDVDKYGTDVQMQLQCIIHEADALHL